MHYYIQKGWKAEEFLRLSDFDKSFYFASMEVERQEKNDFYSNLFGSSEKKG